jgi:uncharacterized membrane protein
MNQKSPDPDQAAGEQKASVDRLCAFSDAVIAVIITIMVLELKPPQDATFPALLPPCWLPWSRRASASR